MRALPVKTIALDEADPFAFATNHQNPIHNHVAFEEYFYTRFRATEPPTRREFLPVCWTNFYVARDYAQGDLSDLQQYLDALPRDRPYFTVCQWAQGVQNQVSDLDLFVYAAGGVGDYPYPLNCMPHETPAARERTVLASFMGAIEGRHAVRERMAEALSARPGVTISESIDFERFQSLLTRSIFALCPRGFGKTSFRICEALEANVIPVYIYDDPWIPFPEELNFEDYGVLSHIDEIDGLYDRLAGLARDVEGVGKMIAAGRAVYEAYYSFDGCFQNIVRRELAV